MERAKTISIEVQMDRVMGIANGCVLEACRASDNL